MSVWSHCKLGSNHPIIVKMRGQYTLNFPEWFLRRIYHRLSEIHAEIDSFFNFVDFICIKN